MKVLTIKEPYASLIKGGLKKIETRSWKTNYRGRLYIHAGLTKVNSSNLKLEVAELIKETVFSYGHIICQATLKDCIYMDEEFIKKIKNNPTEYACGNYQVGRYAWVLEDIKPVSPVAIKGHLGLWNYQNGDDSSE